MLTDETRSARSIASAAVENEFDTIVAAGGDGTIDDVLNGIGDVPDGFARVRLALLPMGSGNVMAAEYGIRLPFERAWAAIERARERVVDLPQVDFHVEGQPVRRYFGHVGGAGLEARVIQMASMEARRKAGALAYLASGIKAINGSPTPVIVSTGSLSLSGEIVLVGNGKLYGGRFKFFPDAKMDDGRLDVCVFPRARWIDLIPQMLRIWTLGSYTPGKATVLQAERFTLTGPPGTVFHVGGEIVGNLPATFSVQPRRLRLIIP
jgi:YegS/Rv2252/BmrU family lipid kinase